MPASPTYAINIQHSCPGRGTGWLSWWRKSRPSSRFDSLAYNRTISVVTSYHQNKAASSCNRCEGRKPSRRRFQLNYHQQTVSTTRLKELVTPSMVCNIATLLRLTIFIVKLDKILSQNKLSVTSNTLFTGFKHPTILFFVFILRELGNLSSMLVFSITLFSPLTR